MVETTEENIDLVNSIIKQTFGKRFKGNYAYNWRFGPVRETYELREICKPTIFGIKSVAFLDKDIGRFIGVVHDKYRPAAKEYAKLYKEKTGLDVTISKVIYPSEGKGRLA